MRRALAFLRPATLVALCGLLLAPGLWLGPSFDASVYTLAGVVIDQGRMPYTNLFDNKPPGLYMVNAFGGALLSWLQPWIVTWILTLAFTGTTVVIIDLLLRRRLPAVGSYLVSAVCAVGIAAHPLAFGGGLTESFAVLPLVVSLWAVDRLQPNLGRAALVGFLGGLESLLSIQGVPVAAILVVAVAVGAGSRRNMFKAAALAIACGAAVPVAVVAWLAARGALGDAIDEVVFYNFAYRGSSPGFDYAVPAAGLILAGLAVPVAALAASMIRRRKEFDRTLWVCLAWVVALVIMIGYENRLFLHYLILAVPALVMLWGPGVGRLIAHFGSADRRTRYLAVAGASSTAALGVVSAFAIIGLTGVTMSAAWQAEAVTSATAGWLDANTPASATVFVWGNDTGLFLASGRSPYDRYVYQYPLVTFGYASPEKTAAILRAWTASPPTVVVEAPANVPMFDQPSAHAAPFDDDTLAPLRDFVRGHYHLVATFGSGGDVEHVYLSVGSS